MVKNRLKVTMDKYFHSLESKNRDSKAGPVRDVGANELLPLVKHLVSNAYQVFVC